MAGRGGWHDRDLTANLPRHEQKVIFAGRASCCVVSVVANPAQPPPRLRGDDVGRSAAESIDLLAFGETYLGGYPFWLAMTGGARFNDRSRSLDAELYGWRIHELMAAYWPGVESDSSATETEREFARIWNAMPRIVFSTTLESVRPGCRLVAGDVADRLAEIRSEFPGDIGVAGATLASAFIERGLVDEYRLVVHPVILGAGTPFFPALGGRVDLRLRETHTFGSGVVYLGYETVR